MTGQEKITGDTLVRATAAEGSVRCMAAITTNTVAEAVARHRTSHTAAAALGRTLTGALLLGSSLKEFDRLTVQIVSDGPLGGITAEANARGQVRGYVSNPEADMPLNRDGKFDVRGVVGGACSTSHTNPDMKSAFTVIRTAARCRLYPAKLPRISHIIC